MTNQLHVWLVRRRWVSGHFAVDSIDTLRALIQSGFLRPNDYVSTPDDTQKIEQPIRWQEAQQIPDLSVSFRLAPISFFSPQVRRFLTYVFSTFVGLIVLLTVAVGFAATFGDARSLFAALILLGVCILHVARRVELSVLRGRYESAVQQSVLFHRIKDGREPLRDELVVEFADWNHRLGSRQTLYEIHTVIELLIASVAIFNAW